MQVRHLKLLYALVGLLWAGYLSVQLVAYHVTERLPVSGGMLFCLLLFVAIPTAGYVLLFVLSPYLLRLTRKGSPA
jgi:hypothetical protein